MSVAALPWPSFNSPFSSPELCSCLQRGTGKSHSCAGNADRGFSRNQAEGRCDPSILLSTESLGLTHFYSSASVFRMAPVLLNPLLSLPFPSLVCPAVSNPQFLSRLYLPWAFSSPSDGYSKNRGCFADVRKNYLADGFFFSPS